MYALGIDLGTTFTAAAIWRNGHAETASLGSRGAAIPSVVLLRDDETFLTGEGASRRGLSEPHRVAREFKRRLGDTTPILLGGVPYSAEALMARLLRTVVDEVSSREGGAPSAITISHPANWGPYKTDLLLQAVRLAGLDEPVSFTTEPEAAAIFYARQTRVEPGAIVAVYDLGGGTFDAAVLRKTAVGFEILGRPEGIERLGGIDFDAAVFSHVTKAIGGKLEELDEDDPAAIAAVARLREECVQAKEALSADTDVSIPVLLPNLSTEVRLTRAELESMVRPALFDSIEALKRALRSADVTADQLHAVLLVGGSSRMPLIAQLVGAELGRPVAVDAHPKHAVALGAAWLASGQAAPAPSPRAVGAGNGSASVGSAAVGSASVGSAVGSPAAPPAPMASASPAPASPAPPASVGKATVGAGAVGAAAVSPPARSSTYSAGSASVGSTASPTDATRIVGGAYPSVPQAPAPPASTPGGSRRPMLIAGAVALLVLLTTTAVVLALKDNGTTTVGNEKPTSTTTVGQTQAPVLPADEQCTDAIKSNPRWVCLTKATISDGEVRVEYEFEDNGRAFDISGGFHLHIYGANADGSNPADSRMGAHSSNQGRWYVEDQQPSVHQRGSNQYQALQDYPKVCARIARSNHHLALDANENYKTGNCVPLQKI